MHLNMALQQSGHRGFKIQAKSLGEYEMLHEYAVIVADGSGKQGTGTPVSHW